VFVVGELGVGKEMIVRLVHSFSARSEQPFVKVNCESINANQFAEVFFGREYPAGAVEDSIQRGAIERASDGTLFLHNVLELPKWMQAKLLQAIQAGTFLRQGGDRPVPFRTRIAASATVDLPEAARRGVLLDELQSYLDVASLRVPPLRDRREDIRPLVKSLMQESDCLSLVRERGHELHFANDAWGALEAYDWPGNVYELSNFVRRAIIFAVDPYITAARVAELLPPLEASGGTTMITVPLAGDLKLIERAIVADVINRAHGNKSAAARALGLHRKTLYRIIGDEGSESAKLDAS
jgi:DNA-binding NtrC family response regulator